MKKTLEPYQLIERSIIKKYRKELWTLHRGGKALRTGAGR